MIALLVDALRSLVPALTQLLEAVASGKIRFDAAPNDLRPEQRPHRICLSDGSWPRLRTAG
ncbi:hypothetical protein GCM10010269_72530 [Streptomyces humidus]|uniref:Uncharacterized protein n=1 Tax=Streptomyces humidus TaxID=52259 RepID=A0A918G8Z8_9ACTN|nr:hypothetical protein [Streptomyces humidus]GGS23177.1 hypothetical protein GCM10010269_72530 [Streptomyces humidus]